MPVKAWDFLRSLSQALPPYNFGGGHAPGLETGFWRSWNAAIMAAAASMAHSSGVST